MNKDTGAYAQDLSRDLIDLHMQFIEEAGEDNMKIKDFMSLVATPLIVYVAHMIVIICRMVGSDPNEATKAISLDILRAIKSIEIQVCGFVNNQQKLH